MTISQKIIGLMTGLLAGVLGAITFAGILVGAASFWIGGSERVAMRYGASPPLGLQGWEMTALIVGLAAGFGAGVMCWSLLSTRMGWLTWEDVLELMGRRGQ